MVCYLDAVHIPGMYYRTTIDPVQPTDHTIFPQYVFFPNRDFFVKYCCHSRHIRYLLGELRILYTLEATGIYGKPFTSVKDLVWPTDSTRFPQYSFLPNGKKFDNYSCHFCYVSLLLKKLWLICSLQATWIYGWSLRAPKDPVRPLSRTKDSHS